MAAQKQFFVFVSLVLTSLVSCISANLLCEDLPTNRCAFAVSSAGSRCVLEKAISAQGIFEYQCQASEVSANEFPEWIETDDCVSSCGLDRLTVGISSDPLMEKGFVRSLCSSECQDGCPNVVDLFQNLSEGEGVSLSQVCKAQSMGAAHRREMNEIETSQFASLSSDTFNSWDLPNEALSPTGSIQHGLSATSPARAPSPL